ncbi:DUF4381 domain-containing protein [Cupriavidus sp. WGtm5]|uniref:DUF4381 domain-containing protein n=1 Tax=Cupriavidus TaxID=106589 RepID=UPI001F02EB94|nr:MULTISPECIES: DUF4381 domain-containing protein [Cupriavidus]MCO4892298.1 DUF4381 domain-containing protein [Cupriavidus sp. WGtm5]ULX54034.1 hypothetical protein A9P79_19080 [Cupriavidus taiwanensis]
MSLTHSAAPATLATLADLAVPPPPSWMPQTIGWPIAGGVLLLTLAWAGWRAWRRYRANRYRREALAELAALPQDPDPAHRAAALRAMAALLKRTALAAWPRAQVASLAGGGWAEFLRAHAGRAEDVAPQLAALVQDAEYRGDAALAQWPDAEVRAVAAACRRWIAEHHVPV